MSILGRYTHNILQSQKQNLYTITITTNCIKLRCQKLISVCRAPFKPLFHVGFWGVVQLVCGSLESLNQAWSNPDKYWCQHHPTHQWGRRLAQWTLGGAKNTWQQRLMVKRIPWTMNRVQNLQNWSTRKMWANHRDPHVLHQVCVVAMRIPRLSG